MRLSMEVEFESSSIYREKWCKVYFQKFMTHDDPLRAGQVVELVSEESSKNKVDLDVFSAPPIFSVKS